VSSCVSSVSHTLSHRLWCTNDRTLESGLVFAELLETVDDKCDENETHEWFHSKITKEEAVDRLAKAGVGSFLVRPSDTQAGNYSLFFHIGHSVQRFRIERRGDRYVMGGRVFRSLYDVIERYKSEQIVEGFRLERAVCKQAFEEHVWSEETARQRLERHKDDSVYQTLRESRELARKSSAIRLSGFLHKKSTKTAFLSLSDCRSPF
jgi:Ras GTPase-activating protein 1